MLRSSDQALIVASARRWIGTPYLHQHSRLGQGVDCVNLIIESGHAAGVLDISPEAWEPYRGYGRTPNPRKMARAMRTFLVAVPIDAQPKRLPADGSIMWMGWREEMPMHLAILATDERNGRRTMIHAYAGAGRCVEHGFRTADWPSRVMSWWSYPGRWPSQQEAV